jgi:branched-chain amino acid transport system substrate-binding protein
MMGSTIFSLIAVVVTAVVAVPGLMQAQQPIRVGASIALTGGDAIPGGYVREGYLLCQQHVNAQGGVLGRPIEFLLRDDGSDPHTAVGLYEQLIIADKVDAVLGPYGSPITDAVAEVTEQHRKLMVAPTAGTTAIWEKGRRYLIMVLSPLEASAEGTLELAARQGLKTLGLLDPLERPAIIKGALELANKKGLEVVVHETYPPGTTDFSAILNTVKAAKPDVLVAGGGASYAIALTRQMRELDVNVKMAGVTPGGSLPDYYQGLGHTAEFVYAGAYWQPGLPYPGNREFVVAYQQAFTRVPSFYAAAAYAGCQLFADAVKRAGSLDSDKVREALLQVKTQTVFGDFAVDERGYQIAHKTVTIQWQDGQSTVVWPDAAATSKPRFPTPPWSQR